MSHHIKQKSTSARKPIRILREPRRRLISGRPEKVEFTIPFHKIWWVKALAIQWMQRIKAYKYVLPKKKKKKETRNSQKKKKTN